MTQQNEKRPYEKPVLEVVQFDAMDIIVTSVPYCNEGVDVEGSCITNLVFQG